MAKKINTVGDYIKSKQSKVFSLADKIMAEMENKIEDAPLNQLASVLGTILDKFAGDEHGGNDGIIAKVFEDFEDVV